MSIITESVAHVRTWLKMWWPQQSQARELARQYGVMNEECTLAVADLMRACLMYDDVAADSDAKTNQNIGKRQIGLHIMAMSNLQSEDLEHLRRKTADE